MITRERTVLTKDAPILCGGGRGVGGYVVYRTYESTVCEGSKHVVYFTTGILLRCGTSI